MPTDRCVIMVHINYLYNTLDSLDNLVYSLNTDLSGRISARALVCFSPMGSVPFQVLPSDWPQFVEDYNSDKAASTVYTLGDKRFPFVKNQSGSEDYDQCRSSYIFLALWARVQGTVMGHLDLDSFTLKCHTFRDVLVLEIMTDDLTVLPPSLGGEGCEFYESSVDDSEDS